MNRTRAWLRPPRLRPNEVGEDDRRATWLELFYDLVYVVAVAALAAQLAKDATPRGVAAFAALFLPVWWSWSGVTLYNDRFDTDDAWHRFATLLAMLGAAALALNVATAFEAPGFALAYAFVRAVLVASYLRVARHVAPAARLARRYALGFGVAAILWAASTLVPPPARLAVWAVAMLVDVATPLTARALQAELPVSQSHLPERIGLFTIIVLGEGVAAVVRGLAHASFAPAAVAAGALGLAVAFALWWVYFENLDARVVRRTRAAGQVWFYAHLPLAMGLAALAVGVEGALSADGPLAPAPRWLLGGAFATCLAAMGVIHLATVSLDAPETNRLRATARFASAAVVLALTALGGAFPPLALMAMLAVVAGGQVVLDPPVRNPSAAS